MKNVKKAHILFAGFIALLSFFPCRAMQKRNVSAQKVALLTVATVAALSEGSQAAEHFMGSVWRDVEHKDVAFSECESGKLGCWRLQEFVKEDDGSWTMKSPYFYEEKVWRCDCIPLPKKEERSVQLIVLPQTQSFDNATCPRDQGLFHNKVIRSMRKKVAYNNATCPAFQKFPKQKRNGVRAQQRGGRR